VIPTIPPAPRAPVPSRWTLIQSLREEAGHQLDHIAAEVGEDSRLLLRCREVWGNWEREALISILHHDYANAEVMLDRGVHALRHALQLVHKDRLSEEELVSLIAAA
jgi:hypothetical protein